MKYSFISIFILSFLMPVTGCKDEFKEREKRAEETIKIMGVQRNCLFSLKDSSLVVVDGFFLKPGGFLHFVEKNDLEWKHLQTIDLTPIIGKYSPLAVDHNKDWLCMTTVPKFQGLPGKLFLFKKENGLWNLVETPTTTSVRHFDDCVAVTSENILIFSESYSKKPSATGNIFCYDLKQSPPKLVQTLAPERNDPRRSFGGFGNSFSVCGDTLVLEDMGAACTDEEFQRYGLTENDRGQTTINQIKQPTKKFSFPVYQFEDGKWHYQVDLFELLPHPPGESLRKSKQYLSWCNNMYYPLISISQFLLTNGTAFLEVVFNWNLSLKNAENAIALG